MQKTSTSHQTCAQHDFITIDGVRLETLFYPGVKSDVPTLVLLHEGLGCIGMWKAFPEQLAELSGYPVFVYSRQGYGRSDPCTEARPVEYMHHEGLDVLPKLLQAANIADYILVGHSDGGSIALIHAGGNPGPGLKALITLAPHVFCEEITVSSIAKVQDIYAQGPLRDGLTKYHHENTDLTFSGWCAIWLSEPFFHWNIEEYLPSIALPQLIIQGKDDQYGTLAQVKSIAEKSAGSVDIAVLEKCAHSPYKEQAEKTLQRIMVFLNNNNF